MDPSLLYENILLNHILIKILANHNTSHLILNYDSIILYPQHSTNTCVCVAVIYALFYLIKKNNDIVQQIHPFDLHNLITKYKFNKPDLNCKISIIDCLYFLHNYNQILDTDKYNFNLEYGFNVFSVQLDWDTIRYYLLNNYPLICNLNLNYDWDKYNKHTMIILGFNNLNKTLSLAMYDESTNLSIPTDTSDLSKQYNPSDLSNQNKPIQSNIRLRNIDIDIFLKLVDSIFVIKFYL